jgi:hypothetical protein
MSRLVESMQYVDPIRVLYCSEFFLGFYVLTHHESLIVLFFLSAVTCTTNNRPHHEIVFLHIVPFPFERHKNTCICSFDANIDNTRKIKRRSPLFDHEHVKTIRQHNGRSRCATTNDGLYEKNEKYRSPKENTRTCATWTTQQRDRGNDAARLQKVRGRRKGPYSCCSILCRLVPGKF